MPLLLKDLAAILTVLTGLVSLFLPMRVVGFTGLDPRGGRGVTEIRAVLGGVFVALGGIPLVTRTNASYWTLGVVYLVVAVVRTISMVLDRSVDRSNVISLGVEIVLGVILVV